MSNLLQLSNCHLLMRTENRRPALAEPLQSDVQPLRPRLELQKEPTDRDGSRDRKRGVFLQRWEL